MQVNLPETGEILIFAWFAASVLIVVVSTFLQWFWLRRRGVVLVLGLTAIPGYMEHAYLSWCRNQGRRPNTGMLVFRVVSIINVVIAAVFAIPLLAGR